MKLPLLAASAALALSTLPAAAVTFDPTNQISFTGGDIYCTPTGSSSCPAGSVTFTYSNPVHAGDATGVFLPFVGTTPVFNNFNYLSSSTPFTLLSDVSGSQSLTFTVEQLSYTSTASSLDVSGSGFYLLNGTHIDGGTFELTTQGATGSRVTFSDTNSIAQAPEPASLALLGTGLLGMVGVVRRRLS